MSEVNIVERLKNVIRLGRDEPKLEKGNTFEKLRKLRGVYDIGNLEKYELVSIDESIRNFRHESKNNRNDFNTKQHFRQLADWLEELKQLRKEYKVKENNIDSSPLNV